MESVDNEALGAVIARLRAQAGLTQASLGQQAGYGKGAGVSISRIEGGLARPGSARLAGIAAVLGLTVSELVGLAEAEAVERTGGGDPTNAPSSPDAAASSDHAHSTAPTQRELEARQMRVERRVNDRQDAVEAASESFNLQHDRALRTFFEPFLETAGRIEEAPPVPAKETITEGDPDDPAILAAFHLEANTGGVARVLAGGAGGAAAGATVGGAAAYGAFTAAAAFGTASTGTAISALGGAAASNATLAWLGGGALAAGGTGVAGGTMVLASIVAAPAALLLLGGAALMVRRNRRQRREFAQQLDEIESHLEATEHGVARFTADLTRAAETLDYIATHGGHALKRWADALAPGAIGWETLAEADKTRYEDFLTIAGAQISVAGFRYDQLLAPEDADRPQAEQLIDEILTQANEAVSARV